MKELFLVRHAKSSWKDYSLADIERPLNKRGKRDAPFMGNKLNEKGAAPGLLLSSTAERAKITAQKIAGAINYPVNKIKYDKTIYEASMRDLLGLLHNFNNANHSVMLFGHNPGLTSLNNFLADKYIDNIPTCGAVKIQFDCDWDKIEGRSGKQIFFIYPKLYL